MTSLLSTTTSRPGRRALAPVATAVAAGLLLGGCSFTSRNVVLEPYAPSDGLQTDLGEVLVRNVLVVSEGDGAPGVLSGALVNRGEADAVVRVEVGASLTEIDVSAGETVFMGGFGEQEGESVVLDAVDAIAGGVVDVSFSDPVADSATLAVPVLRPEGAYAELTPPAGTGASEQPSASASAEATTEPTSEATTEPSTDATTEPTGEPTDGASAEGTAGASTEATTSSETTAGVATPSDS